MQSYQNVSNSQPIKTYISASFSCKRLCKVIKMLAIHNYTQDYDYILDVANAYAKLSKCQQFTTNNYTLIILLLLQTLMQSYQNVSNSQHPKLHIIWNLCCKRLCKVIKMLAIHNCGFRSHRRTNVANAFAKLSKCQQFTTVICGAISGGLLQTLLQSYQNVSNSQLHYNTQLFAYSCKRFCKVIKMLAIHNTILVENFRILVANAFAKLSKCQQFTTVNNFNKTLLSCKRFCKVIKMLAIHNVSLSSFIFISVANAFAKLSKCQQFTTDLSIHLQITKLQTLLQSYQNVSNSQLIVFALQR